MEWTVIHLQGCSELTRMLQLFLVFLLFGSSSIKKLRFVKINNLPLTNVDGTRTFTIIQIKNEHLHWIVLQHKNTGQEKQLWSVEVIFIAFHQRKTELNNCILSQLQRSADHKEAQEQLMKVSDLEDFQEEAQAAYHQGDYSGTINALEKVIEVGMTVRTWIKQFCPLIVETCCVLLGNY